MKKFEVVVYEVIRWTKEIEAEDSVQARSEATNEIDDNLPADEHGWLKDNEYCDCEVVDVNEV